MGTVLAGMRSSMGRRLGGGKQRRSVVVRGAPVVTDDAQGILRHQGMMRTEEGRSIDDRELRRVELTERGRSGGDGSGFIADENNSMVGLR
jgi:hypothetical protein